MTKMYSISVSQFKTNKHTNRFKLDGKLLNYTYLGDRMGSPAVFL